MDHSVSRRIQQFLFDAYGCSADVSGGRSLRSYYSDIVAMQGVAPNLPPACTARLDTTSASC
jgi:hypothetical protein